MKVALCQMDVAYENKQANYMKAGRMIESAVEQGAEMVLFPEMSFTGFSMNTAITAEPIDDAPVHHLMEGYASRFRVAIGYGWVNKTENDMCENHYTMLSEEGTILADYIKIHPFSFGGEDLCFVGGDRAVVFEYKGLTIGLSLCYDLRFPELYTELSKKAEVLIVAANWPASRREHWKCLLKARAIETQSYVIGVNCVGLQDQTEYVGDSMVVSPDGTVMITREKEEVIMMAELTDSVLPIRLGFPVRQDRKASLYRSWYEED